MTIIQNSSQPFSLSVHVSLSLSPYSFLPSLSLPILRVVSEEDRKDIFNSNL